MEKKFIYISDLQSERLDSFLTLKTSRSRTSIKKEIISGNVRINGKVAKKAGKLVKYNDKIEIIFDELTPIKANPIKGFIDVIYEDEDLIAINKKEGLVVHPTQTYKGETLVNYLLYYFKNNEKFSSMSDLRPGIVHRLDKGTTGVLLVAKNERTHEELSKQFKNRKIIKTYESIVWGITKNEGIINFPVGRSIKDRKKMSTRTTKGREAITKWESLSNYKHFSYVRLMPKTGRTHQLRVHMSEIGHPIVGDNVYKKKQKEILNPIIQVALEGLTSPLLHAKEITFLHPVKNTYFTITAPIPGHFQKFLSLLKKFDY